MSEEITHEEYIQLIKKSSRNKYNARKTVVDGITFASKREAERYSELRLREYVGEIRELRLQVKFPIKVEGEKICDYVADFCYYETRTNLPVIEDCKGFRTPAYRIKAKLILAIYKTRILET